MTKINVNFSTETTIRLGNFMKEDEFISEAVLRLLNFYDEHQPMATIRNSMKV
ncbi:MAG: hypothetical protein KAI81_04300 [Candidatus Marinimicrobia bacterium]|nr:hypothetical protein [Candidatus Neomarinimicrobiota bacterium]